MDAIMRRRSIRKYTDERVADEQVDRLLKAAMNAPSARDLRPWHFIVMRDREKMDRVPSFHAYSQMMKEATVAVLICGDTKVQDMIGYLSADLGAATQNLLLEATEMGLGTVWLGIYPREERMGPIRELLSIPDHILPFSLVPIGYPAEEKPIRDKFDPERVHRDGW